jgi:hypothetical protein
MQALRACIAVMIVAVGCGGGGSSGPDGNGGDDDDAPDAGTGDGVLSDDYPGDVGLGADPAVIWFEAFDAGSVAAVTDRYDQAQGQARMQLVTDQPPGAGGTQAMALTAGQGTDAVDLYKQLPDHDEWWVRWYVKYQPGIPWHHAGMWFGGYNPGMPYPSPQAGTRPDGDDRVSFSIEPVFDTGGASGARFDFYNYWMAMHTWQEPITDPSTAYYGNALIHQNAFTIDEGQWVCLEVHVRLNPDAGSGAGAVLEVWKGDAPVIRFDDTGPLGYWIRDKFCPTGGDGTECTDYPAPFDEVLDLQFRSTTQLALNAFWPQNYITDPVMGTMTLDQMVVATTRIGCLR